MALGVLQSLRSFAHGHPPLLVFTLCLTVLGVTMVALAYVIGETDLPNPDVDMDWNVFLTRLSELHYCVGPRSNLEKPVVRHNASSAVAANSTAGVPAVKVVDRANSMYAAWPDIGTEPVERGPDVLYHMSVPSTFFAEAVSSPVQWKGNVSGYMLGISGKRSRDHLQLTMLLWVNLNGSSPCVGKDCMVSTNMCLVLHGPSRLFPKTKRPQKCDLPAAPPTVLQPIFLQRSAADTGGKVNCTGGMWTKFLYKADPDLTVMLSYSDRVLVNIHLINTSYFLFFMVMTLACYAVVWGRSPKVKGDKVLDA